MALLRRGWRCAGLLYWAVGTGTSGAESICCQAAVCTSILGLLLSSPWLALLLRRHGRHCVPSGATQHARQQVPQRLVLHLGQAQRSAHLQLQRLQQVLRLPALLTAKQL